MHRQSLALSINCINMYSFFSTIFLLGRLNLLEETAQAGDTLVLFPRLQADRLPGIVKLCVQHPAAGASQPG